VHWPELVLHGGAHCGLCRGHRVLMLAQRKVEVGQPYPAAFDVVLHQRSISGVMPHLAVRALEVARLDDPEAGLGVAANPSPIRTLADRVGGHRRRCTRDGSSWGSGGIGRRANCVSSSCISPSATRQDNYGEGHGGEESVWRDHWHVRKRREATVEAHIRRAVISACE